MDNSGDLPNTRTSRHTRTSTTSGEGDRPDRAARPDSAGVDRVLTEIRSFWDADAETYDNSRGHRPTSPAVMAAWSRALERLLPPSPARVIDVGAGTGFLSLIAARLGHKVTAVDLSTQMLDKLQRSARREGLEIDVVVSAADGLEAAGSAARGSFDAVMERHLLWTLPDPHKALEAWRRVVPDGRLLLVESVWGRIDPIEMVRQRVMHAVQTWRKQPPDHHASYSDEIRKSLPLGAGTPPSKLVEMARAAGWRLPRLERLRDIEWSERLDLPLPERLVGVTPRFAILAT